MSTLPTLVFVPGSWHKPACFDKIVKLLQERNGLKCTKVTLCSTSGDPGAGLGDDIDATRDAISAETTHGRDVVLVAHSYGGMVASSAIKGFARPRDAVADTSVPIPASPDTLPAAQSHTVASGHVIGIVLIASGLPLTGYAFMDLFFGHPPPQWRANRETGFADIIVSTRDFFYHDLPADEADYWSSQLASQSLKSLFEGGERAYSGWLDVPAWYIGTIEDHGLPVFAQRMLVGMVRQMGASVGHRELRTSHSPFLSQPEETVALMLEAISSFTAESLESEPIAFGRAKAIPVPQCKMWQPLTWFKFGLPLVVGHTLGRCVLIFLRIKGLRKPKTS